MVEDSLPAKRLVILLIDFLHPLPRRVFLLAVYFYYHEKHKNHIIRIRNSGKFRKY